MENRSALRLRRRARRAVLQVLFEVDVSNHSLNSSLRRGLQRVRLDRYNAAFARELAGQVQHHREELDAEIQKYAPAWPVDQLPVVDRNILRIAIYEMEVSKEAPTEVVINEAVELAKVFGGDTSQRFVNGVLGSVAVGASRELVTK